MDGAFRIDRARELRPRAAALSWEWTSRHTPMQHGTAPLAILTLPGHRPAPARVELVHQPTPWRLARAFACLLFFWGVAPLLVVVPPHYPWAAGSLVAGAYLAHRAWTGRFRVRAFTGICPRCEHELSLPPGTGISLPHTMTCFACHFEPQLRLIRRAPPGTVTHRDEDCVGRWGERWLADEPYLVCDACRAHHPADAEARRAAEDENERGRLLARLTAEGDFLP